MSRPLEQLAEIVRRVSGIRTHPAQMTSFGAAAERASAGTDPAGLLADAQADAAALERLVDEVAVKETFFMRDKAQLEQIDWRRLLANAHAAGSPALRVWSAACATGEEPYTLALMAIEAFGTDRPPVAIVGTDLSRTALARASEGRYRARAVRPLAPEQIARHLERDGDQFVVRPALRALVDFERHNLVGDRPPPGAPFDLIVCRNVLIYFDPPGVERALAMLGGALRPGGTLLLGAADRLCRARPLAGEPRLWGEATGPRPGPRTGAPDRRPAARRRGRRHAQDRPAVARAAPAPAQATDRTPPVEPAAPAAADDLAAALRAADAGALEAAIGAAGAVAQREPMNAEAHFVLGVAELAAGDAATAVRSLRRALYADPDFALAAFKLGRAHDALGARDHARRAYEQALRVLDPDDDRHAALLDQIDLGDVAAACRTRLGEISGGAAR